MPRNEPTYDWEKDFVATVCHVAEDQTLSFEQAVAAMRAAGGRTLLEFDERSRRWAWHLEPEVRRSRTKWILTNAWRSPDLADVYLFFESCGRNGHLREGATRALRGYPGRLAFAAVLIRSEDWVDQVADAAARLLEDLAQTDAASHLFGLLDLIVLLRSRQRFAARWDGFLEPMFLAPQWRSERRRALTHRNAAARLLAHDLSLRADPHLAEESLRIAMDDRSPKVTQFALERMKLLPVESRRAMLRRGMAHFLGSIRSAALRKYRQEGFEDLRDVLIAALLDRNSSVRGAAAYSLEREFAFAAAPVWRAAFDAGRNRDAMTSALAESGDASDGGRLRSQLTSRRGRVRAAALQGLLRIGVDDTHALLIQALRDPSSAVVRAAARFYARGGETLDESTLREAFTTADNERLRSRYISLSTLLPKWPRLTFLLSLYGEAHPIELGLLDRQVGYWIHSANRSFIQLDEQRRKALVQSIEELHRVHPAPFWKQLQYLL